MKCYCCHSNINVLVIITTPSIRNYSLEFRSKLGGWPTDGNLWLASHFLFQIYVHAGQVNTIAITLSETIMLLWLWWWCVCVLVHTCVCVCMFLRDCVCACLCDCVHVHVCECIHACVYVCVVVYVRACVCVCVCALICYILINNTHFLYTNTGIYSIRTCV